MKIKNRIMEIVEIALKCGICPFHGDTSVGFKTNPIIHNGAPFSGIKWSAVKFRNFNYFATII